MPSIPSLRSARCSSFAAASGPAFLVLFACSHQEPEPRMTPSPMESPPPEPAPIEPQTTASIEMSDGVRTKCNLPDMRDAPQFDYDGSDLRARGTSILDGVVTCMLTGSMQNRSVAVVGHADPRGGRAYNEDLGMRRASAARDYMTSHGVPLAAITVESRGEQDATGDDPAGWQLDRRVDIEERSAVSSR